MSASRRARGRALAAHIAAGTYVPKPRRSHYLSADVRDLVRDEVAEKTRQMIAQRERLNDREWAMREKQRRIKLPGSHIALGVVDPNVRACCAVARAMKALHAGGPS